MTRRHLAILGCVVTLYGWFVHFWPTFHAANESIRLYFVQAVVDHGTASVDPVSRRYHTTNHDRAVYDGRSYMDKAPGLSFAVMPLYLVLTRLGMSTEYEDLPALSHLLLLFGVVVPAVLGLLWTFDTVRDLTGGDERAAWVAALTLGLATPYALYATLFFGHVPAAALAAGSFHALRRERLVLAGILAGAMVLVETPTAVLAAGLGGYAFFRRSRAEDLLRFGLGGLPFVCVQLCYNAAIFGGPFDFAYAHKASGRYASVHGEGLYGFSLPSWEALLGLAAGAKRGLWYHAPVLLAGAPALRLLRAEAGHGRRDILAAASFAGGYFLWISSFTDWPAGTAYGPRHLVPILPFAAIFLGVSVHDARTWRWLRWALPGLLLCSAVATWAPLVTFPYAPEAFAAPVVQLALPMLAEGHVSPNLGGALGLGDVLGAVVALAIGAGLLMLLSVPWRALLAALPGLALVAAAHIAAPPLDHSAIAARCTVEVLAGHPETAREICEAHEGRFHAERGLCSLPRGPGQKP